MPKIPGTPCRPSTLYLRIGTRFIILDTFGLHVKRTPPCTQIVQRYLLCPFSFVSHEPQSLRKRYGAVYSMRVGSFKIVVADDADSAKEVLCKKSADYAGRPPFHSYIANTLGKLYREIQQPRKKKKPCNF